MRPMPAGRSRYVHAEWRPRRAGRSKVFRPTVMLRNLVELFVQIALWTGPIDGHAAAMA